MSNTEISNIYLSIINVYIILIWKMELVTIKYRRIRIQVWKYESINWLFIDNAMQICNSTKFLVPDKHMFLFCCRFILNFDNIISWNNIINYYVNSMAKKINPWRLEILDPMIF